jgi:DNA-binding MarR family transcriptional regulator
LNSENDKAIDGIARDCIAVRVRLLNRVITNVFDDALRPLGLKVSQLNILVVAAKVGIARPARVCQLLHLDASTLSRNVQRMEAHGWLEVAPDADARAQPFRLTAEGRRLLGRAVPAWRQAQAKVAALLGEEAIGLLRKAAAKLGLDPA